MSLFKKSPGRGAPGHGTSYKYKKRFNAKVSVNLGGAVFPVNPDSFQGTYGGGGRPQVQLDSVVITEGDTYGHLTQAEVTFTCFTVTAFQNYTETAFKLGADASISVGYAEDGAPGGGSFSNLMIYKYSWTTTKDNYVRCTVSCMSATPLVNQADVNVSAKLAGKGFEFMDVLEAGGAGKKTPVQTISQLMKYVAQGSGNSATKDVSDGFYGDGIVVITNPGVTQGEADEETKKVLEIMSAAGIPVSYDNAKLVYCTLDWFVRQINEYYIPNEGKLAGITYEFDTTATAGGCLAGICSADPLNIVLPGGGAGDYGAAADVPDEQKLLIESKGAAPAAIKGSGAIDCKNILLSSSYIASTIFGAASKTENAPDKSVTPDNGQQPKVVYSIGKMFDKLFQDIVSATGGNIHLATLPAKNKKMLIVAYNHNDSTGITPAVFDPVSGNQAIRSLEVTCAPASSDAYAIAVANRKATGAGAAGVNGQDTQGDPGNAAQAIRDAREKGLVQEKFSAASIAGLKEQLGKLVNNASSQDAATGKIPHQYGQFPLNLQVSMDGCTGWEFGDAISVSFLSAAQKGGKGVFIVQKIIHTIATNDWETKLETVYTII
jgi:hypothetical protein